MFEAITPQAAGFDAERLTAAVKYFEDHETWWPRALGSAKTLPTLTEAEPPPWNEIIGPLQDRGGPGGVLLKGGRLVAQWGDPSRVEMTFSVAKSYLAVLAGLAVGDGLINDLDAPVAERLDIEAFVSAHNRKITWRHLLTQSSEWQGSLFGKPDTVDHNRIVGGRIVGGRIVGGDRIVSDKAARKGEIRELQRPGTFYEYNDVRVNVLSLALLHLFKTPLPDVLRERIMAPIGASDDWRWHGYDNADVQVGGRTLRSVPGGTHWGGGLWISALDHARFGLLIAKHGEWQGRRLLPVDWVRQMWTPSATNPEYGLLWWLYPGGLAASGLPESSVMARGAGSHIIWIDNDLDIVLVARWIDAEHRAQACKLVLQAIE